MKEDKKEELKPSFKILICLIEIWDVEGKEDKISVPDQPTIITEAYDIEISESYKNLFSTAKVQFPRGTVIRKTVTEENIDDSVVTANLDDAGVLITTRASTARATVDNFKVGQRIRIYLGYTTDPEILNYTKLTRGQNIYNNLSLREEYKKAMISKESGGGNGRMFDGYITKCSVDDPIEIECEDLASILKKITCPRKVNGRTTNVTVNEMFADDGKDKLLEKTGLKLHPDTKAINITLGSTNIPEGFTVADVLGTWSDAKLFSFIRNDNDDNPCLMIGRSYFSSKGKDSLVKGDNNGIPEIDFSYHVANNNLTLMNTDKAYLAVKAECFESIEGKGKKYSVVIRKNPEYNVSDPKSEPYQILNESSVTNKQMKSYDSNSTTSTTKKTKSVPKADLSSYNIIPYVSNRFGISHKELQEEAIKFFESYNTNGVDGTLTLFGDFNMKSAIKIHLKDDRFPGKNGYYFVDEVVTKFGTSGYRQTIKIPYCISRDKNQASK